MITRIWSFTSSDGSGKRTLAVIIANADPQLIKNSLPKFDIIKPATLVLNNASENYDGTYKFKIEVTDQPIHRSTVTDVIIVLLNVMVLWDIQFAPL